MKSLDRRTLLAVQELQKHFPVEERTSAKLGSGKQRVVRAVDGVSFTIQKGETFSVVGETGCGKTTLARMILGLIRPSNGKILFRDHDLLMLTKRELRKARSNMQMIFQDPAASLNPRMSVEQIMELPLKIHEGSDRDERKRKICETLEKVGLSPADQMLHRYPHEFSGGQKQRIGIARALVIHPELVVADEPVSALDMSIRSQVLNLMSDLKKDYDLTYLLIAHDLSVVRYMSDRVAVMYLGKIVEMAMSEDLFISPLHPYTEALLSAIPVPDPSSKKHRMKLRSELPSPINLPRGCRFNTRCPYAKSECAEGEPDLTTVGRDHFVACHLTGSHMSKVS